MESAKKPLSVHYRRGKKPCQRAERRKRGDEEVKRRGKRNWVDKAAQEARRVLPEVKELPIIAAR